jgi:hypothetical protein
VETSTAEGKGQSAIDDAFAYVRERPGATETIAAAHEQKPATHFHAVLLVADPRK